MRGLVEAVDAAEDLLPFDDLYRRYAPPVYRFCLSQVRNPSDAEDLTADVFAAAFVAYERTRPDADRVVPWLMRIARNHVIDHHRRQTTRRTAFERWFHRSEPNAVSTTDVEHEVTLRSELREVLARCRRLKARDRTLIGLRVAADLSYQQVGEVLGISEHAATMGTKRALQRLRDLYEGQP
ncbi:RNA polymerase sigma factor [Virgisporangium aurantiacum]|uniref:RNA polymerase sigma factor n=1 Tax=Virgisporangium aurantiacum TaxID=175570 RepID=A0A8J3ZH10_9ACTN|nr:RNA polymerase sigma factor [Virgisporangium aurantiacum]